MTKMTLVPHALMKVPSASCVLVHGHSFHRNNLYYNRRTGFVSVANIFPSPRCVQNALFLSHVWAINRDAASTVMLRACENQADSAFYQPK